MQASVWSGLVPSPDDCAKFEALVPGATQFFFDQAKAQTEHRIAMESATIQANISHQRRGLDRGVVIFLGVEVLSGYAIYHGQEGAGILGAAATLFAACGIYVFGVRKQQEERAAKAQLDAAPKRKP